MSSSSLPMDLSTVQLVSEKMIAPSSPTPQHLRRYQLSFQDQTLTRKYLPVALFFPKHPTNNNNSETPSSILEKSLSKLLSFYYPYAGRFVDKDNTYVNCNDEGAILREVNIKYTMSEILSLPYIDVERKLFQNDLPWTEPNKGNAFALAVGQLSHFACGGIALSFGLAHKLGDGYTTCNFLLDWGALARNPTAIPSLELAGASIMPPRNDPLTESIFEVINYPNVTAKRLRFHQSSISRLVDNIASESGLKNLTRSEVIFALLNRSGAIASMRASNKTMSDNPVVICMPLNFRRLIKPPQKILGNILSLLLVQVSNEQDLEIPTLVRKIREEKIKHINKFKGVSTKEVLPLVMEETKNFPLDSNPRISTSLCSYPFYDIDFGWGKPSRVSVGAIRQENAFILLDSPEKGGVDVVAALDEHSMLNFQTDEELLKFASFDPSF